jgi:solute:Na+ symporter, SSS family
MNVALPIIILVMVLALGLGLRAAHGRDMNLEQWSVGGRSFGSILVFVLMAGEIYTTFTFLGASGYAYGHGAPAFYILAYGCLAFIISYWMLPPIWRYGKQHNLISQTDFFATKYNSPALGTLVAIVGIIALVPYLVLQFKGLGIIVETASYGGIPSAWAVIIGAALVATYVFVSGMHGSAWTAVVKDTLILVVVLFLGIYLPFHYYGGYGAMFSAIDAAKPGFLAFPAKGESVAWFDSTVLLTALGFFMWPHGFACIYTAKSGNAFRRNAIVLPLYQLVLLFVFFVGFAAVLQVPGLTGGNIDLSLFRISLKTFDPWVIGIIGAAGVLTALVPGAVILLTAATLLANNLYRSVNRPASDAHIGRVAKAMTIVVAVVGVVFTIGGGSTIVTLLLMGYSFVTQLFPSAVMSLRKRNPVTAPGAFAGIFVGVATVAVITLNHYTIGGLFPDLPQWIKDLNIGIVALVLNVVTLTIVSALTQPGTRTADVIGS